MLTQPRQACIKEAMRLHPGVGFPLERIVPQEGLTVGDVCIPAGTVVGMNAWVIHHNKTIYGHDADDFRPERWIEAEPEQLRMMDKCFLSVSKAEFLTNFSVSLKIS
jgi:cytochrome P450